MTADSLRLIVFLSLLVFMLGWETLRPLDASLRRSAPRWRNNLLLSLISTLASRLLGPVTALAAANYAQQHGFGLLQWWALPAPVAVLVAVIVLDLAIYLQHRAAHRWRWFWRLHRVHHADPGYDVTTAVRFHPLEILLSILIKVGVVVLLGAPVLAVILFEMILNGMAMFNHGNVSIPQPYERWLRALLVTPDMHRIHHSTRPHEHHSNFGFNLSVWDRWLHSYTHRSQPDMRIGLNEFRAPEVNSRLFGMLSLPFRATPPSVRKAGSADETA